MKTLLLLATLALAACGTTTPTPAAVITDACTVADVVAVVPSPAAPYADVAAGACAVLAPVGP